jgi:hypothetical protein
MRVLASGFNLQQTMVWDALGQFGNGDALDWGQSYRTNPDDRAFHAENMFSQMMGCIGFWVMPPSI